METEEEWEAPNSGSCHSVISIDELKKIVL